MHLRRVRPIQDGCPRVLRHFELDRTPGLALDDRNPISDSAADHEVSDPQTDEIAAPELAVDREVEEGDVSQVSRKFETRSDGPDLFWQKRALLADEPALVPWRAYGSRCWELDSGHDEVSIQPSRTRHRHRADAHILVPLDQRPLRERTNRRRCSAVVRFEPFPEVAQP